MSKEPKYIHHSLNIQSAEKAVADEISAEADIDIQFKEPLWSSPENFVEDTVGVFCKTDVEAELFSVAFFIRRWEDSKSTGGK